MVRGGDKSIRVFIYYDFLFFNNMFAYPLARGAIYYGPRRRWIRDGAMSEKDKSEDSTALSCQALYLLYFLS